MDDAILAQQLAKTGNLLDLLNDEVWLQETDAIEAECGGRVEAGLALKPYVEALAKAPPEAFRRQRHQVEILSILLPELKNWLQSWNLGLSFEAVYVEAYRRLYGHLEQFMSEQAAWIEALLAEDEQQLPMAERTVRSQTTAMLVQIFTQEDWRAFADTAAKGMAQGVLQRGQREAVPSAAL
ncbi:MAG: hypothetical protein F6J95_030665 [Leptolyngbya sp. SIO1E4]|nr:hypothetical protein [Leptolyngbya sp. SIO1E4]